MEEIEYIRRLANVFFRAPPPAPAVQLSPTDPALLRLCYQRGCLIYTEGKGGEKLQRNGCVKLSSIYRPP